MDQKLPMFDDTPAETAPKKPKPKPTRKRRRKMAVVRKQRVARVSPEQRMAKLETKMNFNDPDTIKVIGALMNLEIPQRFFAMEVTKALTK